jgi:hypothetical protein
MRKDSEDRKTVQPSHTRGAGRRRRLHRATELWNRDRELCAEHTRRATLITFTFADADYAAAQGKMRKFWQDVRNAWIGTRYFCWLELQRSGRLHYHAIWLNPPGRRRVDLVAWVTHHWPHGRTQVRFKDQAWVERSGTDYVIGYAKKMGRKSYQQAYDDLPRELRTFMSQRLEIPAAELQHHTDKELWAYVPAQTYRGDRQPEKLIHLGRLVHQVARGCQCEAVLKRRPPRARVKPLPKTSNPGQQQ